MKNECRGDHDAMKPFIKSILKPFLASMIDFVRMHPAFKQLIIVWVGKCPQLEARLRRFAAAKGATVNELQRNPSVFYELLRTPPVITPEALVIYDKLILAIKKRNGDIH